MDINYLLRREQIEIEAAKSAPSMEARASHNGLAKAYADRVAPIAFPKNTKRLGLFARDTSGDPE